MPKKEFEDERVVKKQQKLAKKSAKRLKQSKKETQKALDNHSLGWRTRDGKEI